MYLVFAYIYAAWQRLSEDRIPSSLEDEVSAASSNRITAYFTLEIGLKYKLKT